MIDALPPVYLSSTDYFILDPVCHLPCAERVADLVVHAGVDVLEGRILQLLLQTPQAQSIGQGGVDVQRLTADLHLLQLPRKGEK